VSAPTDTRGALGFWTCLALVVGNMIGSGVFMLPASLAPYGWNGLFGWLVTIGGALCLAFVFARLARALPQAGGPYAYTRTAFGRPAGFLVAWAYWISLWVGNAAIAVAGVSYLSLFVPAVGGIEGLPALLAVAVVWSLTAINCYRTSAAGGVQLVTTVLKLLPLVAALAVAGLMLGEGAELPPFSASAIDGGAVTATAALTLWALLGLESATVPAEKVADPESTIPRATLWGTAITGVIYLVVCSAVALMMPSGDAARSDAPIAEFVGARWGGQAALAIALFAAVSAFGALNGWILLQGELAWAMARDGVFPRWLAASSPRGTPVRAHVVSSLLLTMVMLANYSRSMADLFTFVALLATTASLVAYLVCSAAALKLLRAQRAVTLVGTAAVLYSLWTLWGAGAEAVGWGFVLLVAGVPIYWIMRRAAVTPAAASVP
jgi:APA family basic amino acid/polyamine antiporter